MKKLLTAVLLTAAIVAVPAMAGPEEEVQAAEKEWATAVVGLDFAKLDQIYSDGLIYAHSTGSIETKGVYLGKLRSGAQKYTAIIHHKTTIRTYPGAAVAHSIATMKGTNAAGPFNNKLMMIHTWIKEGSRWKLAAHQTTLLEEN